MKLRNSVVAGLLAFLMSLPSLLPASEPPTAVTMAPVVSTTWLAEQLDDPDLVTLHIGPPGSYEERHIPGARKASLMQMIRVNEAGIRDEMLSAEDIKTALMELGIGDRSRVVIYFADEAIAWGAARYLLILEYIGMTGRAAYLDGGLPKWLAEELPVSSDTPTVKDTKLDATIAPDVIVDAEWLSARLGKPGIAIVDGRPAEGYDGLMGHWEPLGHIPGAKNIPFFTLLADEPAYVLKSREELSDMFHEAGAKPGDTVVVYCGTGLWASMPYLGARYLDYEVRLYDGSFQEWSSVKHLPIVAPAPIGESGD